MAETNTPTDAARGAATTPLALVLDDVHVTYRVYEERRAALKDVFTRGLSRRKFREIRAVRGVSLTATVGEGIGVIGPNGSGKSTLMQAIAGLLPATSGRVLVRNRPMLLGVGASLKPDLSGRRNIFIGLLALGMNRRQAAALEPQIIEFAGLEDFIDLPMRAFSSGMRARLQFAIATAATPEILLIDEALAVGDKDFKRRSAAKLDEIRKAAGTVFLVSHSLREVERSCARTLWLDNGRILMDGPTQDVLEAYTANDPKDDAPARHDTASSSGNAGRA